MVESALRICCCIGAAASLYLALLIVSEAGLSTDHHQVATKIVATAR